MSDKLRKAVTSLIGGNRGDRFFAELLFDMPRVADPTCLSMGVGIRGRQPFLVYNPALLELWSDEDVVKVLKHEVLHVLWGHMGRIGTTGQHQIGNIAADLVVNQMIEGMPKELMFYKDGKFEKGQAVHIDTMMRDRPELGLEPNKHFEWYFEKLYQHAEKMGHYQTVDDHGIPGDETGTLNPESANRIWKEKLGQAADRAQRAGDAPQGALRDVLREFLDTAVDWKTALRNFPQDAERTDKSRTRKKRNRRYGFLYAGTKVERKCKLAVGFDLSGSITDEIKDTFAKELTVIAPYAELEILFFDSSVTAQATFDEADFTWKVPGGGGTCFQPVFDRAAELGVDGLIMLTDGENFDTLEEPAFSVLWGILDGYTFKQPFGQHVVVK
tara:strand:+ start:268 stop:1425 length:1158 start_codon:yes stop_codon:yes gene_type:complete